MGNLGSIVTRKSTERAMIELRDWLGKLGVPKDTIDTKIQYRDVTLKFGYKGKLYEFTSKTQRDGRLNLWAIVKAMEFKVRLHLMNIERFDDAMLAYAQLGFSTSAPLPPDVAMVLGVEQSASNESLKARYRDLMQIYHPDKATSELARKEFEVKSGQINNAYQEAKRLRNFQ